MGLALIGGTSFNFTRDLFPLSPSVILHGPEKTLVLVVSPGPLETGFFRTNAQVPGFEDVGMWRSWGDGGILGGRGVVCKCSRIGSWGGVGSSQGGVFGMKGASADATA